MPAAARSSAPEATGARPVPLEGLTRRAEFLAAARGRRTGTASLNLQARSRRADEADPEVIRVGFTCSRKVGNAVARNRAKRRLRVAARAVLPETGRAGWDYVLVGRPEATALVPFAQLQDDLRKAIARIHGTHP